MSQLFGIYEIVENILRLSNIGDILNVALALCCKANIHECISNRLNYKRILSKFTNDVPELLNIMRESGCIITGTYVVDYFTPMVYSGDRSWDFCCRTKLGGITKDKKFVEYLQSRGMVVTTKDDSYMQGNLKYRGNTHTIKICHSPSTNPAYIIPRFTSSVFQCYFTPDYAIHMHKRLTFDGQYIAINQEIPYLPAIAKFYYMRGSNNMIQFAMMPSDVREGSFQYIKRVGYVHRHNTRTLGDEDTIFIGDKEDLTTIYRWLMFTDGMNAITKYARFVYS